MKTATIREAQHNLARILQTVESGEAVEILRRKKPVARIVPIRDATDESHAVNWDGHDQQMALVWGDTVVRDTDTILDDLRGER